MNNNKSILDGPRNRLELRPADPQSTLEARSLLAAIFVGDGERIDRLPEELRRDGGEWWICSIKEVVVGSVGLRIGPGANEGELCWWGVAPARRRMGLGRWMAEYVVRNAHRERGLRRLRAKVVPSMSTAAHLLIDLGFRAPTGFDPQSFTQPTVLVWGRE